MSAIVNTENTQIAMSHDIPLDQNPAAVYLATLKTDSSRRTQRVSLDTLAGMLTNTLVEYRGQWKYKADALTVNWSALRYSHTQALRTVLVEYTSPETANKMLSALRRVLETAFILGQMSADDYQRAIKVKNVKGKRLPAGRHISQAEIDAMIAVCSKDESPSGTRDAAIISLLRQWGLRRGEVVKLNLEDYDPETGELKILNTKTGNDRMAYLSNGAKASMSDWLNMRGDKPGALFLPVDMVGRISDRRLTTQAIYYILKTRATQADVKELSPHDFRRTFVTDVIDKTQGDIALAQKMAGHASITTTERYDRRGEEAKKRAAALLDVAYTGNG